MKLKCINASGRRILEERKVYDFVGEYTNGYGEKFYNIKDETGRVLEGFYQHRFEIVEEEKEMREVKVTSKSDLKVGDRVRLIEKQDNLDPGKDVTGTVKGFSDGTTVKVEFDKSFSDAHDCEGYCKSRHGYNVRPSRLVKLEEVVSMEKVTVAGKEYVVAGTNPDGSLILKLNNEETNKVFDDKFTADKVVYDESARTVTIFYTSDFDKTKPPVNKTQTYVFQPKEVFNREVGFEICAIKARIEIWNDRLVRAGKKIKRA